MDKKVAMKWIKALRSGKYKQTSEVLRQTDENGKVGHCCLGVLAEISGVDKDFLNENGTLDEPDVRSRCGNIGDEEGTPRAGCIKIKIKKQLVDCTGLAQANDQGASFKAIATWIEKNYEKL